MGHQRAAGRAEVPHGAAAVVLRGGAEQVADLDGVGDHPARDRGVGTEEFGEGADGDLVLRVAGALQDVGTVTNRLHAQGLPIRAAGAEPAAPTVQLAYPEAQVAPIHPENIADIAVETISHAEAEQQMSRFVPPAVVGALLALWAAACDGPATVGDTTRALLGTPERCFRQWATENAAAFAAR
ncbi:hypothetical protein [Kitasatospora sp. CB01950]|uniref:hypothetical protein n=1 Tax=Kitasatospora sp. CB01950 TaxID=1703930 RepID=UPI0011611B33|nr:hypothetical protein [Kitasatospora sp. CB01950]